MSLIKKFRYFFGFVSLCLACSFIFLGKANALSQDITISPPIFNITLSPGQIYSDTFNVINQGESSYNFIVYGDPYSVKTEEYTPDFQPIPGAPNPGDWFKFSLTKSNISPGQVVPINFTIQVPKNILSGGYYGVAFAETQSSKASTQGVASNERVGSLFFIQVGGNVVTKGSLASWQTNGWLQKPPLVSSIRIIDSGSVHFIAKYRYVVSDIFGNPKFVLNGQKILLPQTTRKIDLVWQKSPTFGLYKVAGSVTFLQHNYSLSTKYVLLMSTDAKFFTLIVFIVLIFFYFLSGPLRHRKTRKISNEHSNDQKT
jgi:hypothetical protein